jgi:hypothetical protein
MKKGRKTVPVAKFIVPDWWGGGGGLRHRVVVAGRQAGRPVRRPYAEVNYIPHSRTMNLATVKKKLYDYVIHTRFWFM